MLRIFTFYCSGCSTRLSFRCVTPLCNIFSWQHCSKARMKRNQVWLPVLEHIKTIGNFLMKLFSNNPKALGNWGFVVDDSSQKPKLRTTKLKLREQITNKSVVIGSTVT